MSKFFPIVPTQAGKLMLMSCIASELNCSVLKFKIPSSTVVSTASHRTKASTNYQNSLTRVFNAKGGTKFIMPQ